MPVFYSFSGGMESAAMLALERERIWQTDAKVIFADTGKQFPEMQDSIQEIRYWLGIPIITVPRRITFDEFLFERGGMLRKGMTDCSRRMKRTNLMRYMREFSKPYEMNLGYNASETERAEEFTDRNERPWLHWRFPLIEHGITREQTWEICRKAHFNTLVSMYEKMGRFDCYFCPNQKPSQAVRVAQHYPELANEWASIEERKGHSIMSVPFKILVEEQSRQGMLNWGAQTSCSCFGGEDDFACELEAVANGDSKS